MKSLYLAVLIFSDVCHNFLILELDKGDQSVVLDLLEKTGEVLQAKDTLALCYRYKSPWAQGDIWRIDLSEGYLAFYVYDQRIVDNKIRRVLWDFNGVTTILKLKDPPLFFQVRWNNVCYMIDFVEKSVHFFYNGNLVVKDFPDGLKKFADPVNVTRISVLKDRKVIVTDMNVFTMNVKLDEMVEFVNCKSPEYQGPFSWSTGEWKVLDSNGEEMDSITTSEEDGESLCQSKAHFLILPLQGLWPGKEKCNLLSGKLFNYYSEDERIKFVTWIGSWHSKRGDKQYVGLDLSDEEEEGVWKSTETGEVVSVIEKIRPDRISESKYENWIVGQPNGGRAQNMMIFDDRGGTRSWADVDTWDFNWGWMVCEV